MGGEIVPKMLEIDPLTTMDESERRLAVEMEISAVPFRDGMGRVCGEIVPTEEDAVSCSDVRSCAARAAPWFELPNALACMRGPTGVFSIRV